jgi:hypothetical protein
MNLTSFVCCSCNFEKLYKITEKYKNCKPNFVVLCVTKTTTFLKNVYTFELKFLCEKLKCEIPRSVFVQHLYMILSWILDMWCRLA